MNWIYEEGRIYCEDDSKKLMAEAILTAKGNGEIDIEHVFVDSSLRGQGVAGELMETVVEYLRTKQIENNSNLFLCKELACKK